jgi:hypothetical protein
MRRTTAATTSQVVGKRLGAATGAADRAGDGATEAVPGCATPPAGDDHAGDAAAATGEAGADQGAAAGAGADGAAGPADIGLAQEGAARWRGTAAAGSQAFGSTGAAVGDGGLGGSQAPVAGDGGAAGPGDAVDAAAAPGRAAWHFQQLSPAFFEPQLSQVHNSMEDSPRGPRPPGRLMSRCRARLLDAAQGRCGRIRPGGRPPRRRGRRAPTEHRRVARRRFPAGGMAGAGRPARPASAARFPGWPEIFSSAHSMEPESAAQGASMMFGEQLTVLQWRPSRTSPGSTSTRGHRVGAHRFIEDPDLGRGRRRSARRRRSPRTRAGAGGARSRGSWRGSRRGCSGAPRAPARRSTCRPGCSRRPAGQQVAEVVVLVGADVGAPGGAR